MPLHRLHRLLSFLPALLLPFSGLAFAESVLGPTGGGQRAAARLDIIVRVPEVLHMRLGERGQTLRITEADIQRGWVDTAFTIEVTSNARTGFALQLTTNPALAGGGLVEGFGPPLPLDGDSGHIRLTHHGQAEKTRVYPLRVRLALVPGVVPGMHPHPLRVLLSS